MNPVKYVQESSYSLSLSFKEIKNTQINTKSEFVNIMLDLISFNNNRLNEKFTFLDAGCGQGNFIINAIDRYLSNVNQQELGSDLISNNISKYFLGYEYDPDLYAVAKKNIYDLLLIKGHFSNSLSHSITDSIIQRGDFLKYNITNKFDFIIENPPFLRYDNIPKEYVKWIRNNFDCFRGRSDYCIPFIQHSLDLLSEKGKLAIICTNRFSLCDYGRNLRNMIINNFNITNIIDCTSIQPFDKDVSTYPWIYIIDKNIKKYINYVHLIESESYSIDNLLWNKLDSNILLNKPWRFLEKNELLLLKQVEKNNKNKLGDSLYGVDIKVGLATGADGIFINPLKEANIEKEVLTPFILSNKLKNDIFDYEKDVLLNTWDINNTKKLINLNEYLNTSKYLDVHQSELKKRYVAKKNKDNWYRLIDKFDNKILKKEKIIIPSLRSSLCLYFDEGIAYPHHNCYFIIKNNERKPSLKSIGAILSSNTIKKLAEIYAIKFNSNATRLLKASFCELPMPDIEKILDNEKDLESAFINQEFAKINEICNKLFETKFKL